MFVFWLLVLVIVVLAYWVLVERTGRKDAERNSRFWQRAHASAAEERNEARTLLFEENEREAQAMSERWYERDRLERRGAAEQHYVEHGGVWPQ